jgi:hypothetical protein
MTRRFLFGESEVTMSWKRVGLRTIERMTVGETAEWLTWNRTHVHAERTARRLEGLLVVAEGHTKATIERALRAFQEANKHLQKG